MNPLDLFRSSLHWQNNWSLHESREKFEETVEACWKLDLIAYLKNFSHYQIKFEWYAADWSNVSESCCWRILTKSYDVDLYLSPMMTSITFDVRFLVVKSTIIELNYYGIYLIDCIFMGCDILHGFIAIGILCFSRSHLHKEIKQSKNWQKWNVLLP